MPRFVKALFFLIATAIAGVLGIWVLQIEGGTLSRARSGILLGGYVFPDGFNVLRVDDVRSGIDSTTYTISIPACSSSTRWEVSLSGSWSDVESIQFVADGEDLIVRYEASSDHPFIRQESARFITFVYIEASGDRECSIEALRRLFETAYPAYGRVISH